MKKSLIETINNWNHTKSTLLTLKVQNQILHFVYQTYLSESTEHTYHPVPSVHLLLHCLLHKPSFTTSLNIKTMATIVSVYTRTQNVTHI